MEERLAAWPDLTPNADELERVTALMIAGVAAAQTEAPEPGESTFRLLCTVWAATAVGLYLAWDLFSGWLQLHPGARAVLIAVGCVSLVAPLLLIPVLHGRERSAQPEGGTALCYNDGSLLTEP